MKDLLNFFEFIFFNLKNFSKTFHEYIRMENLGYKNEDVERKYLRNMQNNQFLRVKNSLLEVEKRCYGLEG